MWRHLGVSGETFFGKSQYLTWRTISLKKCVYFERFEGLFSRLFVESVYVSTLRTLLV